MTTLLEKLSDVRDFRKILETTVKEIGENYSSEVCQIILSNPLDTNFTSICEYIANPEEVKEDLASTTFPLHLEGGGLGLLSVSRQDSLNNDEINEIRITLANIADILRYAQINDLVQRDTFRSAFMSEITNLMSLPMGLGDALFMVVNILGKALSCSRCIFVCVDDSQTDWKSYEYFQRERVEAAQDYGFPAKDSAIVSQALLSPVPIISFEGQTNSYKTPVQEEMEFIGVRSQLAVAIRSSIAVHGAIILQQCESRHAWTRDEIDIAQSVADTVAEALAQLPEEKKIQEPIMRLYQHDVADTKKEAQQSYQEVRKSLKGALGKTAIPKASKSKQPGEEKAPPITPPSPALTTPTIDFAPQAPEGLAWPQAEGYEQQSAEIQETGYEQAAFEQTGYEQTGYEQTGYEQTGYEQTGYEQTGYEQTGYEHTGYEQTGYEQTGYEQTGHEQTGYEQTSYEEPEESQDTQTSGELSGLADMLQDHAQQVQSQPAEQGKFKGVLNGLLGNQRAGSSGMGAWDVETTNEQPPVPPPAVPPPPTLPPVPNTPMPGSIAAGAGSKWGDLDSIPTPGQVKSGSEPSGGSKWGDLDAISGQAGGPASAVKPSSKWGDLDSIQTPSGRPTTPTGPGAQTAADAGAIEPDWSNLDSIPTPAASQSRSGLGAMMMGKAKASAIASATGLGQSFHKGGMKPPAPPSFVEGPPIQIDEAAAEAKLKQILASSNPTSDYIFATPGIDMRLLGRIDGWVAQVEAKDKYIGGHSRAVAEYATAVARLLGLGADEVNAVRLAAIVHDVGKLGLPQNVLQKPESDLSDSELVMTMNHTINGAKLLEGFPELAPLAPIVLAHHEEFNGNGYPEGLSGEAIPLEARIIHVCNTYVEMVSDLVYRSGRPPEQAQNDLIRGAGSTYDPTVVEALIACMSQGVVPVRMN